jgi:hypothetical protein
VAAYGCGLTWAPQAFSLSARLTVGIRRPDEKITRAARRADRDALLRRPVEMAWLSEHHDELLAVMAGLVGEADRYRLEDADREWVDQLAIDAHDDDLRPATMVILGLAVAELRTAPAVLGLGNGRPFAVHTLLARADRLRGQFAEVGRKDSVTTIRPAAPEARIGVR